MASVLFMEIGKPPARGRLPQLAPLAIAALLLSGCDWLRPPTTNSGITPPPQLAAAPPGTPAAWPAAEWWRGFGAPELDTLMQAAVTRGFDIAAAEARVRQADAQLKIAGASLLPTISLSGDAARSQSASSGRQGSPVNTANLSVAASYEIDFWGRNRATTEAARQTANAARFDLGTVRITTEASVANTYFQFVAAQEQVAIAQANLQAAQRLLVVVRARVDAGTATGLDLAQQETLVAQQRAQIPPLLQLAEQSRNSLATLTGILPESIDARGGVLNAIAVPQVQPGMPAEILVRRPDVLNAEATLAAANANIAAARAALLPNITLTASGGIASVALTSLLNPAQFVFNIAASLVQPIFQGGALRGQMQLSEARAQELLADYRKAIVSALVDSENGLIGLQRTTEQAQLQVQAVAAAERAFTIAEAQLRAGTVDQTSVLLTQQTLFNARTALVQTKLARLQAAIALFRALGGGWGAQP